MWLAETTGSLQLAETKHDEFLGIELHHLTWTNLSHSGGAKQADGRWIEAEEMLPPPIGTTALDTIKEGAMTVIQQMLSKEVAMTVRDAALTRQRDRPRFNVVPQ